MFSSFKRLWNEHPLLTILLIAVIPRLIAAFVSKGYAMHDDHFGPIEQPFMIMHYPAYWTEKTTPHGHSIVYPTIHYAIFNCFEAVGVHDPQTQMVIVRILHALYSLLIVYFGFKIAENLAGRDIAKKTGLILALFWAFPFLGVRNLIEMVCIPPLMAGFYYATKSDPRPRDIFYAGILFGLAFVFRYQTLSISGTLGLILLFKKSYRQLALFGAGFLASAVLIQGSADLFAWGYPFASFIEYVRYNATHPEDYTTGPWYNYALLMMGAFIPPMSFFLLYGVFKNWRKSLSILLPILVFFILHSYFPNKQERFIFPVIPLFLVLGIVGWEEYVRRSSFWLRHTGILRGLWIWFWIINLLLLIPFSMYYSKKTRVEAMYSLYGKPVTGLYLAGGKDGVTQSPFYYSGQYPIPTTEISTDEQLAAAKTAISASTVRPNYVLVFGADSIEQRVRRIESTLGLTMKQENRFGPSFLDEVFYRLNPSHNKNVNIFVFKSEFK